MIIHDFLGWVFKWVGNLIKLATVLWAIALVGMLMGLSRRLSGEDFWLTALLVLVPYQIGRIFSHFGERLEVKEEEFPVAKKEKSREAPAGTSSGAQWEDEVLARVPKPEPGQPVRPYAPRTAAPEVDVDIAAEPAPPVKAIQWGGQKQADVTSMGVDELFDPDKKP